MTPPATVEPATFRSSSSSRSAIPRSAGSAIFAKLRTGIEGAAGVAPPAFEFGVDRPDHLSSGLHLFVDFLIAPVVMCQMIGLAERHSAHRTHLGRIGAERAGNEIDEIGGPRSPVIFAVGLRFDCGASAIASRICRCKIRGAQWVASTPATTSRVASALVHRGLRARSGRIGPQSRSLPHRRARALERPESSFQRKSSRPNRGRIDV